MILHRRARRTGLVVWGLITISIAAATTPTAAAAPITVCHSTGSPTAPWVFLTIDDSTWPEHQAHGDFRATSAAECRVTTPTPGAARVALAPPAQQQPAPTATSQPTVPATATAAPTLAATARPAVAATAAAAVAAVSATPEVAGATVLPPGGEPIEQVGPEQTLLFILLAMGAAGVLLRAFGYHRQ